MKLVIAEKPMLARDIARALCGKPVGERDLLPIEGNGWCVCALAGHVLKLMEPAEIRSEWKWGIDFSEEMLPICVQRWPKEPIEGKEDIVESVRALIKRCSCIVNAGDPDDEGQLLVDELIDYIGYEGPVLRVLVNDNIVGNIRRAFENLRPNDEFRGLSEAAYARQMADMCLGVSESRLATMRLGKRLSVGRVQTPTLGLVVRRDAAVEGHAPETFWAVLVTVAFDGAEYEIELTPANEAGGKRRITDEGEAKDIAKRLEGRELVFDVEKSRKRKASPLPYTLTVLQSEMSKRFGLTLQQTMDATQSLRDKWKAISYNRSDCPYLPREHHAPARRVLGRAMANLGEAWELDFCIESRCFDDSKVGAHHGLIPQDTPVDISQLTEAEKVVYRAIVGRYAMQFAPPVIYDESTAVCVVPEGVLRHVTKRVIDPGYTAVFGDGCADTGALSPLEHPGRAKGRVTSSLYEQRETKPPKRYTEGTLVTDMASVAKYVADPVLSEALKKKDDGKEGEHGGIGTVATRAKILEGLVAHGLLERKGKTIISTPLGRRFYSVVPEDISGADLTARWWLIQQRVAEGSESADAVQLSVAETVRAHISADAYKGVTLDDEKPEVGTCPVCGRKLRYRGKVVSCESNKSKRNEDGTWETVEGCGFKVFSAFCGKNLTSNQMARLLAGKRVKVGGLTWKGKSGRTAELVYDRASHKVTFAPRTDTKGARKGVMASKANRSGNAAAACRQSGLLKLP